MSPRLNVRCQPCVLCVCARNCMHATYLRVSVRICHGAL